jgi:hypothetical protein
MRFLKMCCEFPETVDSPYERIDPLCREKVRKGKLLQQKYVR